MPPACDQVELFVKSVEQEIGSECLVGEATGTVARKLGQPSATVRPPITAIHLGQKSKAVWWLVIELQYGYGGSARLHIPIRWLLLMLDSLKIKINRFHCKLLRLTINKLKTGLY